MGGSTVRFKGLLPSQRKDKRIALAVRPLMLLLSALLFCIGLPPSSATPNLCPLAGVRIGEAERPGPRHHFDDSEPSWSDVESLVDELPAQGVWVCDRAQ